MQVQWRETSTIGEWDCGGFNGTCSRVGARPSHWDYNSDVQRPPVPSHWSVTVTGSDGLSWREYKLPLKRGRTKNTVIAEVIALVALDPIVTVNGQFGSFANMLALQQ